MNKQIANEILRQLGGNKFIAMTGARNFYATENGIGFKVSATMTRNRINFVKVTLNALDTYDVEFVAIRGTKIKTVAVLDGIYNDQLAEVFEAQTGLRTRLF